MMSGIYIHVPFCRQACHYCDFHFSTSGKDLAAMTNAIAEEITLRKDYLPDKKIDTIYFGGGTPSLLQQKELERLFGAINNIYTIAEDAEITLEANPDDLNPGYLQMLAATPVNRLSIGIQSFRNKDLQWMNRAHNARQALDAVEEAHHAGFNNITIDLIYGIPELTIDDWKENLRIAFSLPVNHISAYSLTVEAKTALSSRVNKKKVIMPEDEAVLQQYDVLKEMAEANGFIHYEISNFGKEGFFSRHNTSYWKGIPYAGFGPSAHSFDGKSRQWNVRNNAIYIKALNEGHDFFEREELTKSDLYNEYILTSLRTHWGLDMKHIEKQFPKFYDQFLENAQKAVLNETVEINDDIITLTRKGQYIADSVTSALFIFKPESTNDSHH